MWYVKLNGTLLPTPYQYYSDCRAACEELKKKTVAAITEAVFLD